ncbi:hypothetical protein WN55_07101 [Dufourea novaeangliae]|uniref:Uncharacterized protein n=1 Tax=Dufourea novaeangliae TaxID=178035 RepID=A0A154PTU5_DUFNO|nr:hypothetical protein WN55_07101 [Dufourea novaeangliae]
MKKAMWATFLHKCSTNDKSQHMYCPEGENSWCKWRTVEIATYLATSIFNEGYTLVMKVMESLGIEIGFQAKNFTMNTDFQRTAAAESRASTSSKQARMDRYEQKRQVNEFYEAAEGLLYGVGIAD